MWGMAWDGEQKSQFCECSNDCICNFSFIFIRMIEIWDSVSIWNLTKFKRIFPFQIWDLNCWKWTEANKKCQHFNVINFICHFSFTKLPKSTSSLTCCCYWLVGLKWLTWHITVQSVQVFQFGNDIKKSEWKGNETADQAQTKVS